MTRDWDRLCQMYHGAKAATGERMSDFCREMGLAYASFCHRYNRWLERRGE